jgi:hypothetical protein
VRVLEGGQPGYAVLVFDKPIESAALRVAVRSMQVGQGAFLGPNGSFEREPHYFDAVRVVGPRGGFGYQVGPEIVNHLRENDQIEVSAEDGAVAESGYWENAVPLLPGGRGAAPTLMGVAPAPGLASSGPAAPRAGTPSGPAPGPKPEPPPKPPQRAEAQEPPDVVDPLALEAERRRRRTRGMAAAVGAAVLALAAGGAWALYQSADLRCAVLRRDCPPAPPPAPTPPPIKPIFTPEPPRPAPDAEAIRLARACDADKSAARLYCEEEAECFEPYRHSFPSGPSLGEIDGLAQRAAAACASAETEAYNQARQCADRAAACVAPTCYAEYQRRFASGAHAGAASDDLERAKRTCETPARTEPPGPPPLKDGEYAAVAAAAPSCGIARQPLHIYVCAGRATWQHEGRLMAGMRSVPLQWQGTIDAAGAVSATVGGGAQLSASGRLTANEQAIEMRFPDCDSPVPIHVTGARSFGCPGK